MGGGGGGGGGSGLYEVFTTVGPKGNLSINGGHSLQYYNSAQILLEKKKVPPHLHGTVEVYLCQTGHSSGRHVSHSRKGRLYGFQEAWQQGEDPRVEGRGQRGC